MGISITPEDIAYAEKILLPEGKTFDEERINFIANLDTIDLQAVPGSGKTTALLAKLLILERYLPFEDGSGILVISHTNTAVDEIKKVVSKHCNKLSGYPSFIGTIQAFVDYFLAIPFYTLKFNFKPYRIDADLYDEKAKELFSTMPNSAAKSWMNRRHEPENFFAQMRFDTESNIVSGINGNIVLRSASNSTTYRQIKSYKMNLLKWGYLHYEDAYWLADLYINSYPEIKSFLQKRFKYVFVDEMQDMDVHQYQILEKIFFDEGRSVSKFQRIGDKNQAIYNGSVKIQNIWTNRPSVLALNGSHRLPPHFADIVNCFALERETGFHVNGLGETAVQPHIIIYDDVCISNVIGRYIQIIRAYQESNHIPLDPDHPFKAIAWNTDWKKPEDVEDAGKIRLVDYHQLFTRESHKPKNEYSGLMSYLRYYDRTKKTLEPIRKNILNALLKVLRLESVLDDKGRYYTKRKLITQLRENVTGDFYEKFNQLIYNTSIEIIKGHEDSAFQLVKDFIPELLAIFGKSISSSSEFINATIQTNETTEEEENTGLDNPNIIELDGVQVEIGTVHSSKGQTHTCTLYLETYYQGDYESARLAGQYRGQEFPATENRTYHQQSAVMSYVGLSRPTHLLCVAVHRDRFNEHLTDIDTSIWNIIRIDQE